MTIQYTTLPKKVIKDGTIDRDTAISLLDPNQVDLLPLLQTAFEVRRHYFGLKVKIHIINNAQNGSCPEDCSYCVQAKTSDADIPTYRLKADDEILDEAKRAYESGAFRYCLVSSGREPSLPRVKRLAETIKTIKTHYPIELCLSTGFINDEKAKILKEAGLDRLNHNLNTSERFYSKICTTHTYEDRLNTLKTAKKYGLSLCSGIIIGMGETQDDILDVAYELNQLDVPSIPVNFLIPISGTKATPHPLTPNTCLRYLSVFRLINPTAEIRIAAGREHHLRSLQPLSLYPANSLFLDGYLNTKGATHHTVYDMITDLGFEIDSDYSLDSLSNTTDTPTETSTCDSRSTCTPLDMKTEKDLHPTR